MSWLNQDCLVIYSTISLMKPRRMFEQIYMVVCSFLVSQLFCTKWFIEGSYDMKWILWQYWQILTWLKIFLVFGHFWQVHSGSNIYSPVFSYFMVCASYTAGGICGIMCWVLWIWSIQFWEYLVARSDSAKCFMFVFTLREILGQFFLEADWM